MFNNNKIFIYGCIGLSLGSTISGDSQAAVNLLEVIGQQGFKQIVRRQTSGIVMSSLSTIDLKIDRNTTYPKRFFSSKSAEVEWNTGYVPIRKHVLTRVDTDGSSDSVKQPPRAMLNKYAQFVQHEEAVWHFDPVRSLYFYINEKKFSKIGKWITSSQNEFK